MLEKDIERKFWKGIRESCPDVWYTKIWGGGFQRAGIPDYLACSPHGIFVAIEFKGPKGRISAIQSRELASIVDTGGVAIVVRDHRSADEVADAMQSCETAAGLRAALDHLRPKA